MHFGDPELNAFPEMEAEDEPASLDPGQAVASDELLIIRRPSAKRHSDTASKSDSKPTVFQCTGCRSIVADSLSWTATCVGSQTRESAVLCFTGTELKIC